MEITENHIKQVIVDIAGTPGSVDDLDEHTGLIDLGFSDTMIRQLVVELDDLGRTGGKGKIIKSSSVTADMTVRDVINLLMYD